MPFVAAQALDYTFVSEGSRMQMAGNGMHVPCVGLMIMISVIYIEFARV